jgi:hypothetical protein
VDFSHLPPDEPIREPRLPWLLALAALAILACLVVGSMLWLKHLGPIGH